METLILFAPLIGALVAGFGWRFIGEQAALWVSTGLLFFAGLLSWIVFLSHDGVTEQIQLMRWIESGTLATEKYSYRESGASTKCLHCLTPWIWEGAGEPLAVTKAL